MMTQSLMSVQVSPSPAKPNLHSHSYCMPSTLGSLSMQLAKMEHVLVSFDMHSFTLTSQVESVQPSTHSHWNVAAFLQGFSSSMYPQSLMSTQPSDAAKPSRN